MPSEIAEWIVGLAAAYAVSGLLFAAPFLTRGLAIVDPHAAGAGVAVRLILLPGTVVMWPLLLKRWLRGDAVPVERTPHRRRTAGGSSG